MTLLATRAPTAAPSFALTEEEQELLNGIVLRASELVREPALVVTNGDRVLALMKRLIARRAIPEARVRYFLDPNYNAGGRGQSRRAGFEGAGCYGDDIFRHTTFLKYLHYFLFGADLPSSVKADFSKEVAGCGPITSGDMQTLTKAARQLTRAKALEPKRASEEFYKLAIDCGLNSDSAGYVRKAVRQAR
jgi:hypothetical protein